MKNLRRHWGIILILIAFLALGCGHAIWAPFFVKPDEERRFAYVVHLRLARSLPLVGGRTAMSEVFDPLLTYTRHQAPLYFLLAAALSLPIPLDDVERLYLPNPHFLSTIGGNHSPFAPCPCQAAGAVYLGRFLSLAFGAVVVMATYLLGLRFFSKEVALMGSAGVAFLPTFAFIATSVDNDMAAAAFVTLSLLAAAGVLKNGFTLKRGLAFGLTAGLAALSKLIGLTAFALVPYLALVSPGQRRERVKGAVAALGGLLIPLPWFILNWILCGSPLAVLGLRPKQQGSVMDLREMSTFIWKSFWLDFSPGRLLYGPSWVYWFYGLLAAIGALGLIKALRRHPATRAFVGLCLLQFALIFVPLLLLAVGHFTGGGRYLLAAVGGIMLLLACGVRELLPYRCTPVVWHVALGSLALYALVGVLVPGYRLPSGQAASLPAEPVGFLEDKFTLVKYEYDKTTLAPGEELRVEICWQLLRPVSENYSVFVQLLGREGEREWPVAQVDTYPGLGYYPTCRWKVGEVVRDRYTLRLPEDLPPLEGDLRLIAGMYKFETMERLEAYQLRDGRRERLYQDAFTLGFVRVAAPGD